MSWADLIGSATTAYGSYAGQTGANKKNLKIAREQMQFQERMSNTSIQRRMEDMRLAGINPLLAGKWEASSPAGAQATMQNAMGQGITTGIQSALMAAQLKRTNAEVQNINARTKVEGSKADIMGPAGWLGERALTLLERILGEAPNTGGKGGYLRDRLDQIDPASYAPTGRTAGSGTAKETAWERARRTLPTQYGMKPQPFDQPKQDKVLREIAATTKRIQALERKGKQSSTHLERARQKEIANWKHRRDQLRAEARNQ